MSGMTPWTELLGETLLTKDGEKPTAAALAGKKVVGLYFSAQWCAPCRTFTPLLSTTYEDMVEAHPDFELVFVSSDRKQAPFDEYCAEIPFPALPFARRDLEYELKHKFDVPGIPSLVFLNDEDEIITFDGCGLVAQANGDVEHIWEELTK
ncbi:hypothetical protein PybrP1_010284 [[Pythium] brassicae (nom. inval.)]|nr:hypothetical protein PybrP1_010284 [[Pythium] brassicae (nom. inval.)]